MQREYSNAVPGGHGAQPVSHAHDLAGARKKDKYIAVRFVERALHAGARGYIMKREATTKVIAGLRAVHAGQLFISEKISALMAEKFVGGRKNSSATSVEQLSDRELQVFELLGTGHGTRQIADQLHVGFKTVQAYHARIKEKLNLANATELMRAAVRWHEVKLVG